ncbi:MAG TPA: hypothetical protein VLG25_00290 [Patescibacteria group bacterium]|nr:hypothetical protein [Patescibacteria group bacterium]
MDFNNRENHPAPRVSENTSVPAPRSSRGAKKFIGWRLASVALLFSATVVVVALILYVALGGPASENKYVQSDKYQAIFLNGGQVYFGKIKTMNDKYLQMDDIYYLSVEQQVQPDQKDQTKTQSKVTLVKLGCELHRPNNSMIVSRDQVIFWENLKDDSGENTVPGAIKKYIADNPKGQTCQAASTTTNTTTTPTTTTPTTTTNKKP